jgi:hypothetical protein
MRTVLLIRTRGPQQVDNTTVQYKRRLLFNSRNDGNVCGIEQCSPAGAGRCPGVDMQPVRSVSKRAQVHWGMDFSSSCCCAVRLGGPRESSCSARSNTERFFYRCPEHRKWGRFSVRYNCHAAWSDRKTPAICWYHKGILIPQGHLPSKERRQRYVDTTRVFWYHKGILIPQGHFDTTRAFTV